MTQQNFFKISAKLRYHFLQKYLQILQVFSRFSDSLFNIFSVIFQNCFKISSTLVNNFSTIYSYSKILFLSFPQFLVNYFRLSFSVPNFGVKYMRNLRNVRVLLNFCYSLLTFTRAKAQAGKSSTNHLYRGKKSDLRAKN